MRILAITIFALFAFASFAQDSGTHPTKLDKEAEFKGGPKAMSSFIKENWHYPQEARDKEIEGLVFVGFYVEEDGSITGVQLLRGVDPLLDQEAIRLIELMPAWEPATSNGQPVKSQMNIPINFTLNRE